MMPDHSAARTGRRDDALGVRQGLDEPASDGPRFFGVPAVHRRLPAAYLPFWEIDVAAQPAKDAHDARADLGTKLVGQARNEQSDFHEAPSWPEGRFFQRITLTAAGPCTPIERSFSMS